MAESLISDSRLARTMKRGRLAVLEASKQREAVNFAKNVRCVPVSLQMASSTVLHTT